MFLGIWHLPSIRIQARPVGVKKHIRATVGTTEEYQRLCRGFQTGYVGSVIWITDNVAETSGLAAMHRQ